MENYKYTLAPKKVLILGNGFDLAHGLPTRYSDFMKFCETSLNNPEKYEICINEWLKKYAINKEVKKEYIQYFSTKYNYFLDLLYENIWYKFLQNQYNKLLFKGENWIDFESEISSVIQLIDKNEENLLQEYDVPLKNASKYFSNDLLYSNNAIYSFLINNFLPVKNYFTKKHEEHGYVKIKLKELREILYDDLDDITKALEIYLLLVESIFVNKKLKDIANNYDYIINFNYTHTYQKFYGEIKEIFHIHDEIHDVPDEETNNMVLGVNEYWSKEEKDSHTNFTIFKKFAQRIQKMTGIENYKWFEEIEKIYKNNLAVSEVHIFGHSLDVTDKDILYDYLNSEATSVTIYCKDKGTEGEYIANVIKIIGEERLLKKVNQYPPKLRFVIQQPMVPIDKKEEELSISGATT